MNDITKLGDLKKQIPHTKTVREELCSNIIRMIEQKEQLFNDIKGYNATVIPQIINALICGHNIIFLGERGQGKTRLIRNLISFLDGNTCNSGLSYS